MRLTLRTLLAYLDGILDPSDAQDIGKKIEESEYATGLVHRIRDVMRRMRLGAPSLTDRGPGLDPNAVAEYLDNALGSDAVTEFEKVCLESDVHLAEVAASHQILTLVLGEPAEIDPASRQRMYELKDAPASTASSGPPPTPVVGGPPTAEWADTSDLDLGQGDGESADRKARPRPTVPEYLREPRKQGRWLPVAAAVLLVCFALMVLKELGQMDPGTPLGNALVRWGVRRPAAEAPRQVASGRVEGRTETPSEAAGGKETTKVTANNPIKAANKETTGEAAQKGPAAVVEPIKQPVKEPVKEPAKELMKEPEKEAFKEPTKEPVKEKEAVKEPLKAAANPLIKEPEKTPAKRPTADVVIKDLTPGAVSPPPPAVTNLPAPPASKAEPANKSAAAPATESSATEGKAGDVKLGGVPNGASLPPEPLARFMSSDQVLLTDDPKGGWLRAAPNQMLVPQRVLVLPTYRAKVTLTVGVALEILGGTQVELLASGPQELPGIRLSYGRVVLLPLAQPGTRLRVAFGDRSGVVTLNDSDTVAALDVRRVRVPGSNPEAGPPHIVAKLYASMGSVVWDEPGGGDAPKTLQLAAPQWVSFNGPLTSEPAISKDLPQWITNDTLLPLDRWASPAIAKSLTSDGPARLGLYEAMQRPQKEVRWLALRCLGYLGQFDDMVKALNDPARKLDWPEYVDQLHEAVGRDADTAKAVKLALEKQYPQQATDLYRMLWGYTDQDLQGGADKDLVKGLDDDTLAVRVLSYCNLWELTGLRLFYRPEQTAAKRQQPTARWRQRLDAGEIRLKTPEEKAGAAAAEKVAPTPTPAPDAAPGL